MTNYKKIEKIKKIGRSLLKEDDQMQLVISLGLKRCPLSTEMDRWQLTTVTPHEFTDRRQRR